MIRYIKIQKSRDLFNGFRIRRHIRKYW